MPKKFLTAFLLLAASAAMADTSGYKLRMDSSVEGGKLIVAPQIAAPAGAKLRYEMVSTKQGAAGKSNTSQSGGVTVGADGTAKLSTLSLGVGPNDRYLVTIKVFDGAKLVAEEVLRYPQQ
jgi:Thin aggregative fimbriae synthesis protein